MRCEFFSAAIVVIVVDIVTNFLDLIAEVLQFKSKSVEFFDCWSEKNVISFCHNGNWPMWRKEIELGKKIHYKSSILLTFPWRHIRITFVFKKGTNWKVKIEQCPNSKPQIKLKEINKIPVSYVDFSSKKKETKKNMFEE